MYSFVHSKTRNRLEVEKAEALVYIYTNSRLLRQRAGADPIHYFDGSDGDTSNGGDQPLRQVPLVNPMNAENERVWDWNDIDAEGENGVHELAAVESIVNVQSNEETAVPSAEHLYERADEELDDDANTEVSF
jgi:hypothetical protein